MSTNWAMVTHAEATNPDDSNPVTIQIGVLAIDPDGDDGYTVALGLADTSVVTVTDPTAIRLTELLTEAVAERAIYVEQSRQRKATVLANQLDHAVLTQRQWIHLRNAVSDQHAQRVLRSAAPESWTEQGMTINTDELELDDQRYDTYLALVDSFDTAGRADERLRALEVPEDLLARARHRLEREDAEVARQEGW